MAKFRGKRIAFQTWQQIVQGNHMSKRITQSFDKMERNARKHMLKKRQESLIAPNEASVLDPSERIYYNL